MAQPDPGGRLSPSTNLADKMTRTNTWIGSAIHETKHAEG